MLRVCSKSYEYHLKRLETLERLHQKLENLMEILKVQGCHFKCLRPRLHSYEKILVSYSHPWRIEILRVSLKFLGYI